MDEIELLKWFAEEKKSATQEKTKPLHRPLELFRERQKECGYIRKILDDKK